MNPRVRGRHGERPLARGYASSVNPRVRGRHNLAFHHAKPFTAGEPRGIGDDTPTAPGKTLFRRGTITRNDAVNPRVRGRHPTSGLTVASFPASDR